MNAQATSPGPVPRALRTRRRVLCALIGVALAGGTAVAVAVHRDSSKGAPQSAPVASVTVQAVAPMLESFDRSIAAGHAKLEYRQEETEVEIRTLDSIFKEYAPADVHFLKIDCEGAEPDVIASCDFRKHRPWIILVESTLPLTREETHGAWEPALLAAGYRFVYFDGVNRFYVSEEHADLKRHFETPPNVFDGFMVDRMMQHGAYLEDLRRAEARAKKGWFARLFS